MSKSNPYRMVALQGGSIVPLCRVTRSQCTSLSTGPEEVGSGVRVVVAGILCSRTVVRVRGEVEHVRDEVEPVHVEQGGSGRVLAAVVVALSKLALGLHNGDRPLHILKQGDYVS